MQFRAPTTLKLISYRYSNQILKNFLDLRVISEKSAPEVGSPISDFSGKINGWAQRREAIRPIRGVGFGWFLGKKTRFWAQDGRSLFPEAHIRSPEWVGRWKFESLDIKYNDKWKKKRKKFSREIFFFVLGKNLNFFLKISIWKNNGGGLRNPAKLIDLELTSQVLQALSQRSDGVRWCSW